MSKYIYKTQQPRIIMSKYIYILDPTKSLTRLGRGARDGGYRNTEKTLTDWSGAIYISTNALLRWPPFFVSLWWPTYIFYLFTNFIFFNLYAFSLIVAMFVQKIREINWKFKNIQNYPVSLVTFYVNLNVAFCSMSP